jgi:hypothetical protein
VPITPDTLFFDEKTELRLITNVVNLTERFSHEFELKAHVRSFQLSEPDSDDESVKIEGAAEIEDPAGTEEPAESEEYDSWPDGHAKKGVDFLEGMFDLDEFTVLENIISKDCHVDDPKGGIMEWTENLYLQSRGTDLDTFSGAILSSAFKEQSSKWASITKVYVNHVIVIIHRFMVIILDKLCTDVQVRDEIWSSILDEVLKRYKVAMHQAMSLVSMEREKTPYTVNHYFNENLQTALAIRRPTCWKQSLDERPRLM